MGKTAYVGDLYGMISRVLEILGGSGVAGCGERCCHLKKLPHVLNSELCMA